MRWYVAVLAIFLTGCGLSDFTPHVDYQVVVNAVEDCGTPLPGQPPAVDVMRVGFRKVALACESFFVDATIAQKHALAGNKTLDAGLIGTAAIVNATVSPASAALKALTITTAGVVLAKELINQYTAIYSFGTHLYKVRELVDRAMAIKINEAEDLPPTNYCQAYNSVVIVARQCTLASMQALLDAQVAIDSEIKEDPKDKKDKKKVGEFNPASSNWGWRPAYDGRRKVSTFSVRARN